MYIYIYLLLILLQAAFIQMFLFAQGGTFGFASDVNRLVIFPIERMVNLVQAMSMNPLGASYIMPEEHKDGGEDNAHETTKLLQAICKLGGLMRVGFGEAGAGVIAKNMMEGEGSKLDLGTGHEVQAIFGFCDIRNFTDTTECLQEEVMLFVNRVAHILHGIVSQCSGAANKNIGDAFLLVWKIDNFENTAAVTRLAEQALFAFCKTFISLSRYREFLCDFSPEAADRLMKRFPDYSVRIGCGLHVGWAIEGAIGSHRKIDVSYLSQHVNMAMYLEENTKKYGVPLLMSESFYNLLSANVSKYCRLVDRIRRKPLENHFELYTMDVDLDLDYSDPSLYLNLNESTDGLEEKKHGSQSGASSDGVRSPTTLLSDINIFSFRSAKWKSNPSDSPELKPSPSPSTTSTGFGAGSSADVVTAEDKHAKSSSDIIKGSSTISKSSADVHKDTPPHTRSTSNLFSRNVSPSNVVSVKNSKSPQPKDFPDFMEGGIPKPMSLRELIRFEDLRNRAVQDLSIPNKSSHGYSGGTRDQAIPNKSSHGYSGGTRDQAIPNKSSHGYSGGARTAQYKYVLAKSIGDNDDDDLEQNMENGIPQIAAKRSTSMIDIELPKGTLLRRFNRSDDRPLADLDAIYPRIKGLRADVEISDSKIKLPKNSSSSNTMNHLRRARIRRLKKRLNKTKVITVPVITLPEYDPIIWEKDKDLVLLRHKFTDRFKDIWEDIMEAYLEGNWALARELLLSPHLMYYSDGGVGSGRVGEEVSCIRDGPAMYLISLIDSHNKVPPQDWTFKII